MGTITKLNQLIPKFWLNNFLFYENILDNQNQKQNVIGHGRLDGHGPRPFGLAHLR